MAKKLRKIKVHESYLRERGTDTYCPAAFNENGTLFGVVLGLPYSADQPPQDVIGEFEMDDGSVMVYLYRSER